MQNSNPKALEGISGLMQEKSIKMQEVSSIFEAKSEDQKSAYQSTDTTTRTVFGDNPELAVDRESIIDDVDVLGAALFELLQDLDLMDKVFEVLVFLAGVDTVIGGIDVDDFECHDFLGLGVSTVRRGSAGGSDCTRREGGV